MSGTSQNYGPVPQPWYFYTYKRELLSNKKKKEKIDFQ